MQRSQIEDQWMAGRRSELGELERLEGPAQYPFKEDRLLGIIDLNGDVFGPGFDSGKTSGPQGGLDLARLMAEGRSGRILAGLLQVSPDAGVIVRRKTRPGQLSAWPDDTGNRLEHLDRSGHLVKH
jgi:hypothetical protein